MNRPDGCAAIERGPAPDGYGEPEISVKLPLPAPLGRLMRNTETLPVDVVAPLATYTNLPEGLTTSEKGCDALVSANGAPSDDSAPVAGLIEKPLTLAEAKFAVYRNLPEGSTAGEKGCVPPVAAGVPMAESVPAEGSIANAETLFELGLTFPT